MPRASFVTSETQVRVRLTSTSATIACPQSLHSPARHVVSGDPLPSPCWGGSVVTSDATDYCIPAPKPPTKAPTSRPTRFPTQAPTAKPTLEIDSTADLLGQDIDEDFNDFLKSPNMTADKIEQRLDRHANFYYCELNNATAQGCKIWYKILHVLDNGTSYPLTGYPIE